MERETGIEPAPSAWKAEVLPLNYSRAGQTRLGTAPVVVSHRVLHPPDLATGLELVEGGGFEPPKA